MRYAKPDASVAVRTIAKVVPAVDFLFVGLMGIASIFIMIFAIGFTFADGYGWGPLFFIPPVLLAASLLTYRVSTIDVGTRCSEGDKITVKAYRLFDQITDPYARENIALPLMEKIVAHAPSHGYWGESSYTCQERVDLLRDLTPAKLKPGNKDDIEQAKNYIADMKKFAIES